MSAAKCPFVWYELMTTDAAAATAFYRRVIGWQTADAGMPGMAYTLLSAGDRQIGGLMALPPEACASGARPGWLGYIAVDDVDAMAARVVQAGGAVHRPAADIPGVGRFAVVADPHGAAFCLYRDASGPPTGDGMMTSQPGTVGWHELMAGDLTQAWAFYSGLFGWARCEAIDMGEHGSYQLFTLGSASEPKPIGGMMTKAAEVPAPGWVFYVNVEALDAALARVDEAGGRALMPAMEVPGGAWVAQAMDPQGAVFALVAPRR